jgi:pyrimidine-specific ribonucleoside hydrolase
LLESYLVQYRQQYTLAGAAVHDALAVIAVSHPELISCVRYHVSMDCSDGPNRGRTTIDDRPLIVGAAPNTDVVVTANAQEIVRLVTESVM